MIDWARVNELKDDMGPDDFAEVVELFMSEMEALLKEMAQRFPEKIDEDLHFLKGSAANIGFVKLRETCLQGENDNEKVDPDAIASCYFDSKEVFISGLQEV